MNRRVGFAAVALSLSLHSDPADGAACAGVTMPDETVVDGKQLVLNGLGLREATILNIDVYVAGLYLEQRSADGRRIASSEQLKQIRLKFVRDVGRDDMASNMDQGFRDAAGSNYDKLKPRFEQLKGWIPALRNGETFSATYRPGKGLEVRHGSKLLGVVAGADFAKTIFSIWLGAKPPNPGLRDGLLGKRCG